MKRDIEKVELKNNKYNLLLDDQSVLVFDNTEENKNNIEFLLDEQLYSRIDKLTKFIKTGEKRTLVDGTLSFIGACALTFGGITGFAGMTELICGYDEEATGALITSGALIGTYAIIRTPYIVKSINFKKEKKQALTELTKLNYLKENTSLLKTFKDYDNSLVGLDEFKQQYIKDSCFPFTIADGDNLTLDDYLNVVDNINYEKSINKQKIK